MKALAAAVMLVATACSLTHSASSVGPAGDAQIRVYLPLRADAATLSAVHQKLLSLDGVKSVTYVSPSESLKLLSKSDRRAIEQLGSNPLPGFFLLKLADPAALAAVARAALKIPAVASCGSMLCVSYGRETIGSP